MVRRCYNSDRHNYKYYGGRGIKVCDRWIESFNLFIEDMGDRPEGFELERIDNDGDYTPDNCKWVSHREQTLNRSMRKDNSSGYKGVYRKGTKWEAGVRRFGKYIWLGNYSDIEEAKLAVKIYEA